MKLLVKIVFAFVLFVTQTASAQNPIVHRVRMGVPITLGASNASLTSNYQWYRDGVVIQNANSASLLVNTGGLYQLRELSAGSCSSDMSDGVLVIYEYADLAVTEKSATSFIGENEVFEYYFYARNNGNTDDTNVVVVTSLPSNLTFIGIDDSASEGTATFANGTISWNIPLLRNGDEQRLVVKVKSRFAGTILNTAVITGSLPDPDLTNNTVNDTKKVIGKLRIPNVFTPNGDGKNDYFVIDGIQIHPNNVVSIFNRWGNEVYRSTGGYKNTWDGAGLSSGTYYYVIKVDASKSDSPSYAGWITILRDK